MKLSDITGYIMAIALLVVSLSAPARTGSDSDDGLIDPYAQREYGSIHGIVLDAETGEPIMFATIRLKDTGRYRASRDDGTFQFDRMPVRSYTVTVHHIGYAQFETAVSVPANDTLHLNIRLSPSVFQITGSVVVTGTGRERGVSETYQPTSVLGGLELQRMMQGTLPASLTHLPGIAHQSFGSAAAQPVIRGMGGDRVLVLEDGQRSGDLSTTAADHTVAVEPVTAERIEVVRGPAGLLYGSNALGGVINVIRDEIPRNLSDRISGSLALRGETYNSGISGGGMIMVPAGPLAIRGELSGRKSGDIRTPAGMLPSTGSEGYNAAAGVSWVTDWGHLGASFRQYDLAYGVPGEFNDVSIPGAHEGGVDIEFIRRVGRFRAIHYDGIGPFSDIELEGTVTHYVHREIEGETATGNRIIGAEFDQVSANVHIVARHIHDNGGIRAEGAAGISVRYRDLLAGGGFTGTRSATETVASAYAYEEFSFIGIRLQTGLRYDWTAIVPNRTDPIRSGDRFIPVRRREFHSLSGSAALLYEMHAGWKAGISAARAFRNPAIEELFSDGPHLADYSFDIGNPELDPEIGVGIDIFLRGNTRRLKTDLNVFYNTVSNFIYYEPTGEIDPRLRRFPVFQARSDDALFYGGEGKVEVMVAERLILAGTVSYVHATRTSDDDPLPFIPPLNGIITLRYEGRNFFGSLGWTAGAAQNRVPSAIDIPANGDVRISPQLPTPSYSLISAGAGYRWTRFSVLHTVTLNLENVGDIIWLDHLSRIKDIAPQPGRNLRLSYQIIF
jgi:iron complex outermembrane recepter protein